MMEASERLYRVPLDSGVVVHVRPISPFMRALLVEEARAQHPDPDSQQYRKPLKNAVREGLTEPPEENPEYGLAVEQAARAQNRHLVNSFIDAGVVVGADPSREAVLEHFAADLARIRQGRDLPEDNWFVLVKYHLIASQDDIQRIINAANDALTEEDIRAAAAIFQRKVEWQTTD